MEIIHIGLWGINIEFDGVSSSARIGMHEDMSSYQYWTGLLLF